MTVGPGGDDGCPLVRRPRAHRRAAGRRTAGQRPHGGAGRLRPAPGAPPAPRCSPRPPRPRPHAAAELPGRRLDPADAAAVRPGSTACAAARRRRRRRPGSRPEYPGLAALPRTGAGRGRSARGRHAGGASAHYQGPVAALRRARTGLLLCPGPGDADVLGIRLPRTPLPASARVAAGWSPAAPRSGSRWPAGRRPRSRRTDDRPQSSSSAGPISCVAYQASS